MRFTRILAVCMAMLAMFCLEAQAKELQHYVDQVQALLTKEKVQNMMGVAKKLKESGLSYQHSLTFPLNVERGDGDDKAEDLRVLIGVYQFDALYSAAFGKKREAAASIKAKGEMLNKLNIKGEMDISAIFPPSLKRMLKEPDKFEFDKIVAAYADAADQFHKIMGRPAGFDIIEASLYGFLLEGLYIVGKSAEMTENNLKINALLFEMMPNLQTVITLYEIFENDEDYATFVDPDMFLEKGERLGWLKVLFKLIKDRKGILTEQEHRAIWKMSSKEFEELVPTGR